MITQRFIGIILIFGLMGQSMDKPAKASLRSSKLRHSARSLQKQSYRGTILSKRGSMSASKLQNNDNNEQISVEELTENTRIRHCQLFINSRYDDSSVNIKQVNQIKTQKVALGGQNELSSPNFREFAQPGNEYGLTQWTAHNNSKQVSPNDTHHHEITISFSKAKNNPNMFHEEVEVQKSKLKKILEQEESNLNQGHKTKKVNIDEKQYICKEIQDIGALKSIYSQNYKTPSPENTPKKNKNQNRQQTALQIREVQREQTQAAQSKLKKQVGQQNQHESKKKIEQHLQPEAPKFNDYDTDFHMNQNEINGQKKTFKISKKMQELKQKIANRSNFNREKLDISRYSMERLSASMRKYRNSCSFDKSADSKNQNKTYEKIKKLKEKLSKTQFLHNETIESIEHSPEKKKVVEISPKIVQNLQKKEDKKDEKNISKKPNKNEAKKQQLKKVKSDQHFETTKKKDDNPIQKQKANTPNTKKIDLLLFNQDKAYLFKKGDGKNVKLINQAQNNLQIQKLNQKEKKISFTEMVKKEHFNNKQKKSKAQSSDPAFLKFSQVQKADVNPKQSNLFSSTCDPKKTASNIQYEFFDYREGSKLQRESTKLKSNQINSLKKITEELNSKNSLKKSSNLQSMTNSKNNSTEEHSFRNKTFQQKCGETQKQNFNMNTMSFMDTKGNFEEYMLNDALKRFEEGKERIKQEKRKSKSTQHFGKFEKGPKNKLIIF